jgi:hypothetical protein
MPTIPSIQTLQAGTPNILNAIRNTIGGTYKDLVPMANNTNESIREIGSVIMQNTQLQNSFLNALVNRIGMTIITSKSYTNPWSMFKKGTLDFGETIEEIFVSIAEPHQYNPTDAEETLFKRSLPDVASAFHRLNYAKFYPQTVQKNQLKQAFLSMNGVTDLINKIIESIYTAVEYDEFLVMKYMLARTALDGKIYPVQIAENTVANLTTIVSKIKSTSTNLTYMNDKYNMANVKTHSQKDEQYVILNSEFESQIDVNVLASAFNMDRAEFIGQRVGVDSFGDIDSDRLAIIFADDSSYIPLTSAEITKLTNIPAMIVDKEFFMIFDNMYEMTDIANPKGLYWNYFYHVWKTFSISPFANAVLFTTVAPSVTSVTVTPETATVVKGMSIPLTATVVTEGFVTENVKWTIDSTLSVIEPNGILSIGKTETATTITATATSVFDNTKSDTAVITIA